MEKSKNHTIKIVRNERRDLRRGGLNSDSLQLLR